jgi:hypothetical protein
VFDRIRKLEGPTTATAEEAFQNIDVPLAAGIERWKNAIAMGGDNCSAPFELAILAEQRDELALAAEHYEKAPRILPDRRSVLVDLGHLWKAMGRTEDVTAALLAASRGGEPRAAEMARELLPDHTLLFRSLRQPSSSMRRTWNGGANWLTCFCRSLNRRRPQSSSASS